MNPLASRAALFSLLSVTTSCNPFGSDLKDYRDVGWHMTALNGQPASAGSFVTTLDSYSHELDDGTSTSCNLDLRILTFAGWNWVEDLSGRIVAVGGAGDGRNFLELNMHIYPECTHSSAPRWWLELIMTSEVDVRRQSQELRFAPLVLREGQLMGHPLSADALAPLLTSELTDTSLGATIDLPLTLNVSDWTFSPERVPQELVAQVERTLVLRFTRSVDIHQRGSP